MSKDWTGNNHSTFSTLGASNHSEYDRAENDYYATDPVAIKMLAQTGFFEGVESVWECACGGGHLVKAMEELGLEVVATDLYDQGYGEPGHDFLKATTCDCDAIVTNPPYKYALEFAQKMVDLDVDKFAMFLKLTFLEGQKRLEFFQNHPPRYVAVCANRIQCAKNGDPKEFAKSSAACYAWFIWERGYKDKPEIVWLNKKQV